MIKWTIRKQNLSMLLLRKRLMYIKYCFTWICVYSKCKSYIGVAYSLSIAQNNTNKTKKETYKTNGNKDEPNIVPKRKSKWRSQHGIKTWRLAICQHQQHEPHYDKVFVFIYVYWYIMSLIINNSLIEDLYVKKQKIEYRCLKAKYRRVAIRI